MDLKEAASAGASKNLSVEGVIGDPVFTGLLVDLKQHHWSPEPSRRAEELEAHFRTMLDRLREKVSGRAAVVRLVRVLAFLLPADLH